MSEGTKRTRTHTRAEEECQQQKTERGILEEPLQGYELTRLPLSYLVLFEQCSSANIAKRQKYLIRKKLKTRDD